ncbi:MAG: hypothetical protein U0893_11760 [Chloroflexota bacterium]
MQRIHVPTGGLRYWVALCTASVLGCNTGDGFASIFGFLSGLPILLALFGLTLFLERRDDRPRQIYYWTAIIIVRTAATNLADFTDQHLRNTAFLVLGLLLLAALAVRFVLARMSSARQPGEGVLDRVDLLYWATMLVAGTLGTALGDFSSFRTGLGLAGASLVLSIVVAGLIGLGSGVRLFSFSLYYWATVVAIRTAGTSAGDYFARIWGLPESTLVFAVILVALLALWPERPRAVQPSLQPGMGAA